MEGLRNSMSYQDHVEHLEFRLQEHVEVIQELKAENARVLAYGAHLRKQNVSLSEGLDQRTEEVRRLTSKLERAQKVATSLLDVLLVYVERDKS